MDESDSDAEPAPKRSAGINATRTADDDDDDDDAEKYPVDGKFTSQAEKSEVMGMREMEREQFLEARQQEIDRLRQRQLLRQWVTNEERKAKKKRRADSADLDDGARQTSRQRTGKAKDSGMDTLRKARAEKAKRKEDRARGRDTSSPARKESAYEESDEDDYGRARSRTPEKEAEEEQAPPELQDYDRVRLGRNEFAQVCFTPGFDPAIVGCYIRIALGPHPETGIEQYRMAVIKGTQGRSSVLRARAKTKNTGFTMGKAYAITGPNGAFVTDQYVRAAHGKAVKEFPFIAASSGKFSEVGVAARAGPKDI